MNHQTVKSFIQEYKAKRDDLEAFYERCKTALLGAMLYDQEFQSYGIVIHSDHKGVCIRWHEHRKSMSCGVGGFDIVETPYMMLETISYVKDGEWEYVCHVPVEV